MIDRKWNDGCQAGGREERGVIVNGYKVLVLQGKKGYRDG